MRDNANLGESLHLHTYQALDKGEKGEEIYRSEALAIREGTRPDNTRYTTLIDGIAVIDMIGPIYPRSNMMTMSGATSVQSLAMDYARAINSESVRGIILNIDSPGGDVRGISEAAQMMFQARRSNPKKPVKAYAGGYMASAAYFLGSTAGEIIANDSALVGSIGVVLVAQKKDKDEIEIVSSVSPNKRPDPGSDEGRAILQEQVDDLADIFVAAVAKHRGISTDDVINKYGKGNVSVGMRAKKNGLVDRIGTLGALVDEMARATAPTRSKATQIASADDDDGPGAFTKDETMSLKDMLNRFRSSNSDEGDGTQDMPPKPAAPPPPAEQPPPPANEPPPADGDKDAGDDTTTTTTTTTKKADPSAASTPLRAIGAVGTGQVQMTREDLEERYSAEAELFATRLVTDSRVWPAYQEHAATDFLTAKIDDAMYGGSVRYVTPEGHITEGTREQACHAKYDAMPRHSLASKNIQALKDGQIDGKVLTEGDTEKVTGQEVSRERTDALLGQSPQGRAALEARKAKAQG